MEKFFKLFTGGLQNCYHVIVSHNKDPSFIEVGDEKSIEIKTHALTSYESPSSNFLQETLESTSKDPESLSMTKTIFSKPDKSSKTLNTSPSKPSNVSRNLYLFTEIGDLSQVKLLISIEKPDLNNYIDGKENLLHLAARLGHYKVCKLLISAGAYINFQDYLGKTPLHIACKCNHIETVKALLEFKPDTSILDHYGKNIFAYTNSNYPEIIELMLRYEDSNNLSRSYETSQSFDRDLESPESQISISSFKILKRLGSGRFSEVFLASYKPTGQLFALKILEKQKTITENLISHIISERNILCKVTHPFIVQLHFAFQCESKLYLALTYYSGGTLSNYLSKYGKFSEDSAKFFICEIILALEELHSKSIIYRDLKPDNILIDGSGHVGLSDFGLSKQGINEDDLTHSFCGSVAYMAPEVLLQVGHGKSVDWYLLGVLIYEMIFACTPFYCANRKELFDNIVAGSVRFPSRISDECMDLVLKLLEKDPKKRIGFEFDADEIKAHLFFRNVNWTHVYAKSIPPPFPAIVSPTPIFTLSKDSSTPTNRKSHNFNWSFSIEKSL